MMSVGGGLLSNSLRIHYQNSKTKYENMLKKVLIYIIHINTRRANAHKKRKINDLDLILQITLKISKAAEV